MQFLKLAALLTLVPFAVAKQCGCKSKGSHNHPSGILTASPSSVPTSPAGGAPPPPPYGGNGGGNGASPPSSIISLPVSSSPPILSTPPISLPVSSAAPTLSGPSVSAPLESYTPSGSASEIVSATSVALPSSVASVSPSGVVSSILPSASVGGGSGYGNGNGGSPSQVASSAPAVSSSAAASSAPAVSSSAAASSAPAVSSAASSAQVSASVSASASASSAAASSIPSGTPGQTTCSNGKSTSNAQCCVWYDVLEDIQANLFEGGQCNDEAHESVRLSFHDAIGFSPALFARKQWGGGGADGSIMHFASVETNYNANLGTDDIVEAQRPFAIAHGVSFGDFIQFAGAVATSNCPGAPRLEFLAGRSNDTQVCPDGLVPEPTDSVTKILSRVGDAGFSPNEMVALLASHTLGGANKVDPTISKTPFDTTPNTFDTQFFLETMLQGTTLPGTQQFAGEALAPFKGEMRLQSDQAFATDSRTWCAWQGFVDNQELMMAQYKAAVAKMAVLGQNPASLTDCSEVIPIPQAWTKPASYPGGFSKKNIVQNCPAQFPSLQTQSSLTIQSIIQ